MMNNMIYTVIIVTTILLSSCAQMQQQRDEDRGKNLTRSSYGPLNKERPTVFVNRCQKSTRMQISSTQPTQHFKGDEELATQITTEIMTTGPIKVLADTLGIYIDEKLQKEDLVHLFKIPSGLQWPYVRLLYRDYDSIDFWFDGAFLNIDEADTAAKEYCSRWNKMAVFEGYIEHCGITRWTPFVKKETKERIMMTDSDVIVSYSCVLNNKSKTKARK